MEKDKATLLRMLNLTDAIGSSSERRLSLSEIDFKGFRTDHVKNHAVDALFGLLTTGEFKSLLESDLFLLTTTNVHPKG